MPRKKLSDEKSTELKSEYFYEVVVYRIYKNRIETLGSKFYRTTLPYKNEDIQIVKDNDCIIMKQVIELWNC